MGAVGISGVLPAAEPPQRLCRMGSDADSTAPRTNMSTDKTDRIQQCTITKSGITLCAMLAPGITACVLCPNPPKPKQKDNEPQSIWNNQKPQ